jgi:hypothetical protein
MRKYSETYFSGKGRRRIAVKFSEINAINDTLVYRFKSAGDEERKAILREYFAYNEPFLSTWTTRDKDSRIELTSELYLKLPEAFMSYDRDRKITVNSWLMFYKNSVFREYNMFNTLVKPSGSWGVRKVRKNSTEYVRLDDLSQQDELLMESNITDQNIDNYDSVVVPSIESVVANLLAQGASKTKMMHELNKAEMRISSIVSTILSKEAMDTNAREVSREKTVRAHKL